MRKNDIIVAPFNLTQLTNYHFKEKGQCYDNFEIYFSIYQSLWCIFMVYQINQKWHFQGYAYFSKYGPNRQNIH